MARHVCRRTAHTAAAPTITTATTMKGQIGVWPPDVPDVPDVSVGVVADGPGVPVPAAVSENDQEPETACPSADVTR
jgi:hypothetical protein